MWCVLLMSDMRYRVSTVHVVHVCWPVGCRAALREPTGLLLQCMDCLHGSHS